MILVRSLCNQFLQRAIQRHRGAGTLFLLRTQYLLDMLFGLQ
jgi:hypothetical protein